MDDNIQLTPKINVIPFQIAGINVLARYAQNIANRTQFCTIVIIGRPGSGKTNLVTGICNVLTSLTNCKVIYARGKKIMPLFIDEDLRENIKKMVNSNNNNSNSNGNGNNDNSNNSNYLVFILDDFSYVLDQYTGKDKSKLKHTYTKLRHDFKGKKIITFLVMHYKKAIAPILRDSYIRIYTHVDTDILKEYKEYKAGLYLKNFIRYINRYYIENKPFVLYADLEGLQVKQHENGLFIVNSNNSHSNSSSNGNGNGNITTTTHNNNNAITTSTPVNLMIYRDNERMAILDFGTDYKYLYYNILYNKDDGKLHIDNLYVIGKHDEGFDVQQNQIIVPATDEDEDEDEDTDTIGVEVETETETETEPESESESEIKINEDIIVGENEPNFNITLPNEDDHIGIRRFGQSRLRKKKVNINFDDKIGQGRIG